MCFSRGLNSLAIPTATPLPEKAPAWFSLSRPNVRLFNLGFLFFQTAMGVGFPRGQMPKLSSWHQHLGVDNVRIMDLDAPTTPHFVYLPPVSGPEERCTNIRSVDSLGDLPLKIFSYVGYYGTNHHRQNLSPFLANMAQSGGVFLLHNVCVPQMLPM